VYTLAEVADRMEIQDRISLYCHALDAHEWDRLDEVFLPDAVLDFSCLGLAPLSWLAMKERLRTGRPAPFDEHIYTNTHITFTDDRTRAHTMSKVYNPQGMPGPDGKVHFFGNHGVYVDEWIRTPAGWRIRDRRWDHRFNSGDYPFPTAMPRAAMYELTDAQASDAR
jgi:hypothetical protein